MKTGRYRIDLQVLKTQGEKMMRNRLCRVIAVILLAAVLALAG